jgi:hypothetical protein
VRSRLRGPPNAPSLRVQLLVAEELEGRAAELVGPRLGDDVDDAGGIAAVLGGVVVGDDAELLHRLGVRRRVAGAAQAGGVVAAVELKADAADLRLLGAVDRRQLLGTAERVGVVVARDAAGDRQERVDIAIDERQIQHLVLADAARERRRAGLDERCIGDHRYDFLHRPGPERRVDARVAPDVEHDARLHEVLEAGEGDLDLVAADRQERQRVVALGVGDGRARLLRVDVGGGHCRAGNGGARVVLDVPQDRAGRRLGVQRRGRGRQDGE